MERAVETSTTAEATETLTLAEAAVASGYSVDRLRELVREGRLPATGEPGALRLRRADLPRRPPPPAPGVGPALADQIKSGRR